MLLKSSSFYFVLAPVLTVMAFCPLYAEPEKKQATTKPAKTKSLANQKYACGGFGPYADYLGIVWWRDWGESYKYPPPSVKSNKMWTVGKMGRRRDDGGPFGRLKPTKQNVNNVFKWEKRKIHDLIINKGYTGQYWEIATEPNYNPRYDPKLYAYQYHLYYKYIKSLDKTAKILNGGVNTAQSKWRSWIDSFRRYYRAAYGSWPPVNVWNVHPYAEFDGKAGKRTIKNIIEFRKYLNRNRMSKARIWITEFGKDSLEPESEANIIRYINEVCRWLNKNHRRYRIDRWFWWGTRGCGSNNLFTDRPFSRDTIKKTGDAYVFQSGRVFVDPDWTEFDTERIRGSLRNPYRSRKDILWALRAKKISGKMIVYDFSTGETFVLKSLKVKG